MFHLRCADCPHYGWMGFLYAWERAAWAAAHLIETGHGHVERKG